MGNDNKPLDGVIISEEKNPEENKIVVKETTNNLPAFPTEEQIKEYSNFLSNYNKFIDGQLVDKTDYGEIPGTNKPTLLKPGAEKLEKLFFLTHRKERTDKQVGEGYISYTYRTIVYDKVGNVKATCEGTCNSKETKYRYTTVFENKATPEQKAAGERIQKTSKANKPYFVYRIEKRDVWDIENTIMKMAQKRSYVGAMLEATGSSGRFTQDVEDMPQFYRDQKPPVNNNQNNKRDNNNYNRPPTPPPPPAPSKTPNLDALNFMLRGEKAKTPEEIKATIDAMSGIQVDGKIDERKAAAIMCLVVHPKYALKSNNNKPADQNKGSQQNGEKIYLTDEQKNKIKELANPEGHNPKDINYFNAKEKNGNVYLVEVGFWITLEGSKPRYQKEVNSYNL